MPSARIGWLAFCSGGCLKRAGRQLYPTSDLWKELIPSPAGFTDETITFDDALGLPRIINLYTTKRQPVLQYRVTASTNVLGSNFPLEFHLAQYRPSGTNGWELHLTAKGNVTAISTGEGIDFPTGVEPVAGKSPGR